MDKSTKKNLEWVEAQKAKYKNSLPEIEDDEDFTHQAYREQQEDYDYHEFVRQNSFND